MKKLGPRHNLALPVETRLVRCGSTCFHLHGADVHTPTYDFMRRDSPGVMRCTICDKTMTSRAIKDHLQTAGHRKKAEKAT